MLLACSASNGKNLVMARRVVELAEGMGMSARLLDLTEVDLPLYTPQRDDGNVPPSLSKLETIFAEASTFFVCAPEYNGSIPPTLSNTIAWLSTQSDDFRRLFNGKSVGLATHSGGGGQKVLVAMRLQFSHLGCNVVGREVLTNSKKPFRDESAQWILNQLLRSTP